MPTPTLGWRVLADSWDLVKHNRALAGHAVAPPLTRYVDPEACLDAALADGHADVALPLLMERHGPTVYRYCRRMLGADADSEDVAQIVFMQAFEAICRITRIENPLGWLLGIARHRCIDRLRGRRRAPLLSDELEPGAESDAPEEVTIRDPGSSQALDDCLDQLDVRSRIVLLLRFRDELSYEAIGRLVGDRPGALRVRVARALRVLRGRLKKKGIVP